jgi:peptidoglycan LD-endopeptidase CwlK
MKWYNNKKTKSIIYALHPKVIDDFANFATKLEKQLGLVVLATSGYRTFEEQSILRKKNSSNAKPGYSSHNYGFALDLNILDSTGKNILQKKMSKTDWIDSGVVKIAKDMGFKWGGDFSNYHDPVHFYKQPMSIVSLRSKHSAGKVDSNGYVIL